MILSVNPNLTEAQVRTILQQTATDMGSSGFDNTYGYGRVNAYTAVKAALPEITGPPQFCTNETYQISNLPIGATVTWTATGSINISGANNVNPVSVIKDTNGTGTLIATITTSCGTINITSKTIYVGLPAWNSFINGNTNVVAGDQFEVFIQDEYPGATSYTWNISTSNGYISNTGEYYASGYFSYPGIYDIWVTAHTPCGDKELWSWIEVFPNDYNKMSIYPNPTNSSLNIELGSRREMDKEILLYNHKGIEVRTGTMRKGETRTVLDTRDLPNGTYFLHIKEGKETIKRQIIIQH